MVLYCSLFCSVIDNSVSISFPIFIHFKYLILDNSEKINTKQRKKKKKLEKEGGEGWRKEGKERKNESRPGNFSEISSINI